MGLNNFSRELFDLFSPSGASSPSVVVECAQLVLMLGTYPELTKDFTALWTKDIIKEIIFKFLFSFSE